jgi:hypothetical protein
MFDVDENCRFLEQTLKLTSLESLSLKRCTLKVRDTLDSLSQLRTLKFKDTDFKLQRLTLNTLKEMLNPSISCLEFLSLDLPYSLNSLEKSLDFFSSPFPRLRTVHLRLSSPMTMNELVSFRRLDLALSRQAIFSDLVIKVNRLTVLEKSQKTEYKALGIYRNCIEYVLLIISRKFGIQINAEWQGSEKIIFHLRGLAWDFKV